MRPNLTFTVPGTPCPKGRPRFYNGRTITDAKTQQAEQNVLACYLASAADRNPWDGPITVLMKFYFAPSKSWPKWKITEALAGNFQHTKTPDLDNLAKIIDGLNSVAWNDDSQIMNLQLSKAYAEVPRTEITIVYHDQTERSVR